MNHIDMSSELRIVPHYNGVKLIRPDRTLNHHRPNIGEIMAFPCNAFFLSRDSTILNINEHSVASCGYVSINDALGTTVFDVLKKENAEAITRIDKRVIRENQISLHEELMIRNDDAIMNCLSVKVPLYDEDNRIAGL